MRKLLILTAITMLASSLAGCRLCERWFRGAPQVEAYPTVVAPAYSTSVTGVCDPCAVPASAPAGVMPAPIN